MQLAELQSVFSQYLLGRDQKIPAALASTLSASNIPIDDRLQVYSNHVAVSLSNVITSTFLFVRELAGEEFLQQAADAYIKSHPPAEACLDRYGNHFAEFLENSGRIKQFPFIADAAHLDWALHSSETAGDSSSLSQEQLASLPPEKYADTYFELNDSVRLLSSSYPLAALYRYTKALKDRGDANSDDIEQEEAGLSKPPMLEGSPCYLMVFRVNWTPQIFELDASEYNFLTLLSQKQTLGAALEQVLASDETFDFDTFWNNYFSLGIFSSAQN